MELMKQFPKGFFAIPRPIAKPTNNPEDKIIPIKWSKEVINGKKEVIVSLPKESRKK